jgi:serine/arginine repetitive matrix protein 2
VDPLSQKLQDASDLAFQPTHSDVDEGNPSRETSPSVVPETPLSAATFSHAASNSVQGEKGDPPVARDSVASSSTSAIVVPSLSSPPVTHKDRGHSDTFTDWEEAQTDREGLTDRESSHRLERSPSKKRESGGASATRWERVITTITGRRSRSNSFARTRKEEKAETSVSRESGTSGKTDVGTVNGSPSSQISQGQTQLSATSLLSLAASAVPPPRNGFSPVPPFSASMAKYNDPKLMPLPGLIRLEEERRTRHRRLSLSASGDGLSPNPGTAPNTRVNSPEPGLVHQASDSRLLARYRSGGEAVSPGESSGWEDRPITPSFFNLPPSPSAPKQLTLPQTKEAALRWLTQRKKDGRLTPQPSINGHSHSQSNGSVSDTGTVRQHGRRKPSLTDLLSERMRGADSGTERDERADRTTSVTPRAGSRRKAAQEYLRRMTGSPTMGSSHSPSISTSSTQSITNDKAPNLVRQTLEVNGNGHGSLSSSSPSSLHTSPLPQSSPSPSNHQLPQSQPLLQSPQSQSQSPPLSQSPSPSPSQSQSQSQTQPIPDPQTPSPPPVISSVRTSKSSFVLQRLDSILNAGDSPSVRGSASLGTPPRKFVLSTIARQIVSPNEVKNRLLLLFNDILVIAKFHGEDVVQQSLNRTVLVRNVVELHKIGLQIHSDQTTPDFMQLSAVKSFVRQFPSGPDDAIAQCIERSDLTMDPPTIGNLLYRSVGLDSVVLGQYLSRRSNKVVLRAYLDRFPFKGLRIDLALRVFLLAIHLPSEAIAVEHSLATFASRWFDMNKGVVTFDHDLTTRLVLAIIQLNSVLHPDGLDNTPTIKPPNSHILARDFIDAFRVMDPHSLVTDDLLQKIYISIRNERLVQALASTDRASEIQAALPIPIPHKLTARAHSSSITIKIPQPDANFRIHLHGPDLFFDPPVLDFSRSNEASFVIVGSTLGAKDMIMVRSGANAARYSNLPLTRSIVVERSFMRNSFTVGFVNPTGVKRKYRFNIPEDEEYQQWQSLLRRHVHGRVAESSASQSTASVRVQQVAEQMAVQVLRDAIIPCLVPLDPRPISNGTSESNGNKRAGPIVGHELVVMCLQNSLIPVVLTLLQAARPPDAEPTGVGGTTRHDNGDENESGNGNGNGRI